MIEFLKDHWLISLMVLGAIWMVIEAFRAKLDPNDP